MVYNFEYDSGVQDKTQNDYYQTATIDYLTALKIWLLDNIPFITTIGDITYSRPMYYGRGYMTAQTTFGATLEFLLGWEPSSDPAAYIDQQIMSGFYGNRAVRKSELNSTAVNVGSAQYRITAGLEIVVSDKGTVHFSVYTSNYTKSIPAVSPFYFTKPVNIISPVTDLTTASILLGAADESPNKIYAPANGNFILQKDNLFFDTDNQNTTVLVAGLITSGSFPICQVEAIYINNSYDSGSILIQSGSVVLLNGKRYRGIGDGLLLPYY
ncbi:MAG: hypothetical protein LBR74_09400 [Eubacterium sp.]|jgi:hypothetical protein|nr:hypothetical protein [Eubacterium sp.]